MIDPSRLEPRVASTSSRSASEPLGPAVVPDDDGPVESLQGQAAEARWRRHRRGRHDDLDAGGLESRARGRRALRAVDEPGRRDVEAGLPKALGQAVGIRELGGSEVGWEALLEEREVGRQQPDTDRPREAPAAEVRPVDGGCRLAHSAAASASISMSIPGSTSWVTPTAVAGGIGSPKNARISSRASVHSRMSVR